MKKISLIVKELIFGIVLFGILTEVVILLALDDKLFYTIGLIVGVICAIFMTFHMNSSMEDALDLDEINAGKHLKKSYGLRTMVVLLMMFLVYYTKVGSIITMFIGVMGLKVGAYIQPFTSKYITKKYIGKGR